MVMEDDLILQYALQDPSLRNHVHSHGKEDLLALTENNKKQQETSLMVSNHSRNTVLHSRSNGHGNSMRTDLSPPQLTRSSMLLYRSSDKGEAFGKSFIEPLPLHAVPENMSESEKEFWKQPNS
jgi:hypothetical protein